ncbi:hypothetical protein ANRL3_00517 [Anaerolineae bacterium]|nr:hypothetical protein ANRL3_00517 [Anaerolineae bacterium]
MRFLEPHRKGKRKNVRLQFPALIKIEFVPLDDETVRSILIVDAFKPDALRARRARVCALAALGLTVGDDESSLDVWHKHLCRINTLEFTHPLPLVLADAILAYAGARKMEWSLA